MKINPLTAIDFYKADHRRQYPEGTELVVSNFTARSGKHSNTANKSAIRFFGLQYFCMEFLIEAWNDNFFYQSREAVVKKYKSIMDASLGKDAIPMDHIEALHKLGYLPIEIKAVAEGSNVPVGIPCLTIHNTLPEFFWLTNYLETILSSYLWLGSTSATTAHEYRKLLEQHSALTGSPDWFLDWQAHDFSMRGMSSLQSALVSGAAHLLSFKGSDTVPAIEFLEHYYGADNTKDLVAGSVPATEHSVMCMGGETDELDTFRRIITKLYPTGIVSIVSDTWDFWNVITEYATTLHQEIMSRDGKVVFRPDSGNPADILCGTALPIDFDPTGFDGDYLWDKKSKFIEICDIWDYVIYNGKAYLIEVCSDDTSGDYVTVGHPEPITSAHIGAVQILYDIFGGTVTDKGFKLLDSHVGLIYGDSITYNIAKQILERLQTKGFASANVVLGVGSYTYQYVTRDTWGFAVKATYGMVSGEPRNISKNPKTDDGVKKSAKGLLVVNPDMTMKQEASWDEFNSDANMLKTVFKDGNLITTTTLTEIRERMKS